MDDIARYNLRRWQALADANALFTRPHAPFTSSEVSQSRSEAASLTSPTSTAHSMPLE